MIRVALAVFAVVVLAAGLYFAFSGYGQLSPRGAELALALRGATGRQDIAAIEKTAETVQDDTQSGAISEQEAQWLNAIIAEARNGDWASASDAASDLMGDQMVENQLPEL